MKEANVIVGLFLTHRIQLFLTFIISVWYFIYMVKFKIKLKVISNVKQESFSVCVFSYVSPSSLIFQLIIPDRENALYFIKCNSTLQKLICALPATIFHHILKLSNDIGSQYYSVRINSTSSLPPLAYLKFSKWRDWIQVSFLWFNQSLE